MITSRAARHAVDINCARKVRYETADDAVGQTEARIRRMGVQAARKLYVYSCETCGGWHLTRKKHDIAIVRDKVLSEDA